MSKSKAGTTPEQQSARTKNGARWETLLEEAHKFYRRNRTADLIRLPVPFMQVGTVPLLKHRGKAICIRSKRSTVDFMGCIRDGHARQVLVEAKSTTNKGKWQLGKLQPHQAAALFRCARYGGIAGVALYSSSMGDAYWLPAEPAGAAAEVIPRDWLALVCDELRSLTGETVPGVKFADLEAAGLLIPRTSGIHDWLHVALEQDEQTGGSR